MAFCLVKRRVFHISFCLASWVLFVYFVCTFFAASRCCYYNSYLPIKNKKLILSFLIFFFRFVVSTTHSISHWLETIKVLPISIRSRNIAGQCLPLLSSLMCLMTRFVNLGSITTIKISLSHSILSIISCRKSKKR